MGRASKILCAGSSRTAAVPGTQAGQGQSQQWRLVAARLQVASDGGSRHSWPCSSTCRIHRGTAVRQATSLPKQERIYRGTAHFLPGVSLNTLRQTLDYGSASYQHLRPVKLVFEAISGERQTWEACRDFAIIVIAMASFQIGTPISQDSKPRHISLSCCEPDQGVPGLPFKRLNYTDSSGTVK